MKKIILALAVLLAFPVAVNAQECYTVQKGDSFGEVASNFHLSIYELMQANPQIQDLDWIFIGEKLTLPEKAQNEQESAKQDNVSKEEAVPAPEASQQENTDSQETAQPEAEQKAAPEQESAQEETVTEKEPVNEQETATESQFEQEVIRLTNEERAKQGLAPLKAYSELSDVARDKSKDMRDNGYFDHNSPNYGSPFDMMETYGIDFRGAGENIAAGQRTPEQVVEGWMNSEGHRANILNKDFTHIGVGHVEGGNYGHYWTQMFVTK
ncbi:CAP domain-containing protein [Bacillus piscicola]|uniref:CAP domain-containing protein n=1 Tax=Bacillus piscicola TaxID=1632684 RepID=UPI001F094236|nr:CAP domain-containing protein [Bacillus piscicola]